MAWLRTEAKEGRTDQEKKRRPRHSRKNEGANRRGRASKTVAGTAGDQTALGLPGPAEQLTRASSGARVVTPKLLVGLG